MDFKITKIALETRHKEFLMGAASSGSADGILGVPHKDADSLSAAETLIMNKYQGEIDESSLVGSPELTECYGKYNGFRLAFEALEGNPKILEDEMTIAVTNRDTAINHLDDRLTARHEGLLIAPHFVALKTEFATTDSELKKVAAKVGRAIPLIQINRYVYGLLITALGICEFPLNFQVFKSFKSAPLDTIIMSGVLVIALPLMAHFSGMFLKQRKENPDYRWYLIISVTLMFILSGITSYLRMQYLTQYQNTPIGEAYTDMYAFFTIGIVLYFVGTMASFFAHDESHALEVCYNRNVKTKEKRDKETEKVHKNVDLLKKEIQGKKDENQAEFLKIAHEINSRKATLNTSMLSAGADYDAILRHYQGLEIWLNSKCKIAVSEYQSKNTSNRGVHPVPKYFGTAIPDLVFQFDKIKPLTPDHVPALVAPAPVDAKDIGLIGAF